MSLATILVKYDTNLLEQSMPGQGKIKMVWSLSFFTIKWLIMEVAKLSLLWWTHKWQIIHSKRDYSTPSWHLILKIECDVCPDWNRMHHTTGIRVTMMILQNQSLLIWRWMMFRRIYQVQAHPQWRTTLLWFSFFVALKP